MLKCEYLKAENCKSDRKAGQYSEFGQGLTVVYKHHNNTIRLTIQHKAALTTCVYR